MLRIALILLLLTAAVPAQEFVDSAGCRLALLRQGKSVVLRLTSQYLPQPVELALQRAEVAQVSAAVDKACVRLEKSTEPPSEKFGEVRPPGGGLVTVEAAAAMGQAPVLKLHLRVENPARTGLNVWFGPEQWKAVRTAFQKLAVR